MTDRDIEIRLKNAVEACTPDVLEDVLAKCDRYEDTVPFKKRRNLGRRMLAAAAACAIIAGSMIFGSARLEAKQVASVISYEVNPSIELKINKEEIVLEANAMSEEATKIIGKMQLEGTDIYTATNAIVGSLLKNGYIDEVANSILLSVEDEDSARGASLQESLSNEISAILEGAAVNASILSQYVDGDGVDAASQEYHISHGKAALIERIMESNTTYSFEELAQLSVNDLNLILSNSKNKVENVKATGKAADNAYIGSEEAKEIALKHAGVTEKEAKELEAELDYDHHVMVYEVEFQCGSREYEYDIDAVSGKIIYEKSEYDD